MWFELAVAEAAEPTVGGTFRPEVWGDLAHGANENPDEDFLEVDTWARLFANGQLRNGDRWFVEGRLQHHVLVGPGDSTTPTEGWWDASVGETGWDGKLAGPVRLRAGALVERWGNLSLLPVADVLNPRDLRSGMRQNLNFQKLPVPMGVVSLEDRGIRMETTLIPFATADRMWLRDTDWSYARQGFSGPFLNEATSFAGTTDDAAAIREILRNASLSIGDLSPSFRRGLDATVNGKDLPEALLWNGEVAERMEVSGRNVTLGLMGGWLRAHQPESVLKAPLRTMIRDQVLPNELATVQDAMAGGPLNVTWPRTAVAGLDGSVLAGPFQLRAESMFKTRQVVRRFYGNAAALPYVGVGGGVDWMHGATLQVTLEARWQHLFEPPKDLMFSLEDQVQLAGGVRWVTARDRLAVQLGGMVDVSYGEGLFKPSAAWRVSDHVSLELMGNVLAGKTAAPLGFLDDGNDVIGERSPAFAYTGGPLSYFQQNDEIGLAIELIR